MLLAFDGFDEVLDEVGRRKIISLLKFLKYKTAAKVWITTRLHYRDILETELSTFAIEFDPLNDDSKEAYVNKYLKDRMCLILSKEKFDEVFVQSDGMKDNESIKVYISNFLNKMKSVFKSNIFNFIGTPLQLYLMLEGSICHFKEWIENCGSQNLNFDYLGIDILDVYKKFLDRKYDVYFRKMGIKEGTRQAQDKFIFNQYNKYFAKSLILKTKSLKFLEKFKHIALSAGIIKSNGTNVEFIHITFRDYFAAKVFIRWIKKVPNALPHLNKHKFLLQEIFQKPDNQQIRTFIDLSLRKMAQTESFTEIVNRYGMIVEKLFREEESCLVDKEGTALHCAVEEANRNIFFFMLSSFREHTDVLKKFLFHRVEYQKSVLDLAVHKNDIEILKHLLDATAGISKDALQELLYFSNVRGENVLDTAAVWCKNFELFKELMNRAENKLDLIMNENKANSSLNVALAYGNEEFARFLIQEFIHDENSLKQLLVFNDKHFSNALGVALTRYDESSYFVEYLLCTAKKLKDNETLKKLLLPDNYPGLLRFAIISRKTHYVEMLLRTAEDINEDTLKQMLLEDARQESVFLDAAKIDHSDIIKLLLETAERLGKNVLEKFAFSVNVYGENALHLMAKFRHSQISADNIKLLLETAASLGQEVLEKLVFAENNDGKHAIQLIVEVGRADIIESLFKTPEEVKYQGIREKVVELFNKISEEHDLSIYKMRLISAKRYLINDVKSILESVKDLKINILILRDLLLVVENEKLRHNALHIACADGNLRIIKELLSCAISINDEGKTLMNLISSPSVINKTPFEMLKFGYNSEIKQILDSLISEAETNKNGYVVKILQEINDNYGEINSSPKMYASLLCNN